MTELNKRLLQRSTTTQPREETPYNTTNAALKGASLAFSKPPVKPKPALAISKSSNNGALAAATKADAVHSPQQGAVGSPGIVGGTLSRQNTGSSYRSNVSLPQGSPFQSALNLPQPHSYRRSVSPSNIAASLAAARYTPTPSKSRPGVLSRGLSDTQYSASPPSPTRRYNTVHNSTGGFDKPVIAGSSAMDEQSPRTDNTSIPPTSSLVKLFEQQENKKETKSRLQSIGPLPTPLLTSDRAPPPLRSPKPQRKISLSLSGDDRELQLERFSQSEDVDPKKQSAPAIKPKPTKITSQESKTLPQNSSSYPSSPKSRPQTSGSIVTVKGELSSPSSYVSAQEFKLENKAKPNIPPPRKTGKATKTHSHDRAADLNRRPVSEPRNLKPPAPEPTSALDTQLVDKETLPKASSTFTSSAYQKQSMQMLSPHMTGDSLANAMVGAALASSRTGSPTRNTGPPALPRRNNHQHHHHHIPFRSRTPSPPKRIGKLRTTMRKDRSSSSSSEDRQKPTIFFKKHPNKHHEGTRKRWRDSITELERKRYEGVWAANQGLLLSSTYQDEIHGLVARDIWRRSRLPESQLAEIWDLVDRRSAGRLGKEEFVVALWLIDQRLKGRKLPSSVSQTVWDSVRGIGVRVKVKK
jgi:hypothetical protein